MPQSKPIGLILLWGIYLALFYFIFKVINPFIYSILWSAIFSILFYPVNRFFLKITKNRQTLSAGMTLLVIVFLVVIPGISIVTLIITEAIDFAQEIIQDKHINVIDIVNHPYIQKFLKKIEDVLRVETVDLKVFFQAKLKEISSIVVLKAEQILFEIPSKFFDLFIIFFTTFFMIKDGKAFGELLRDLLPFSESEINYYFSNLKKVILVTFLGILLTAFVQGLVAFIAFYFIGIKSSLLLGLAVAISSLVPMVGSALVWVPLAIYLLAEGLILKGILVIVVGVFFISLVDNFVRPIFLHQYLSLHLVLTFFSLFGGIKAFGLIGIFLGPIIISAFIGCCLFYQEFKQKLIKEEVLKNEGS